LIVDLGIDLRLAPPGRAKATLHTNRKFGALATTTNRQGVRSILDNRRRMDDCRDERPVLEGGGRFANDPIRLRWQRRNASYLARHI
jgi:hypothetical protein